MVSRASFFSILLLVSGCEECMTIKVDELPGFEAAEVATRVESLGEAGVIAERAIYFDYGESPGGNRITGGHDSIGATRASNTWYFAEGYTGN